MNFKKYLPTFAAIGTFLIITLIYFSPLLKGKVINQSDIVQFKGTSKEIQDYRKSGQGEALWTNSMFGGMPAYQVSTLYPGNWLGTIDKVLHLGLPHPSGYIFMTFLGFYILLLSLGIGPWLALAGALAYGFSSYFFIILEVGHNSKSNALSYLAPILAGIIFLMRRQYWTGFILVLLFLALELNANHVQITYYGFLVFALVFAAYFMVALREKQFNAYFKSIGFFATAALIALLPNMGSLLATYEYGHYTTRGPSELSIDANLRPNGENKTSGLDKDYATQYSYGIGETFTFLIPNFKGGSSGPIVYTNKEALKHIDPELREQVGQEDAYFGDQSITAGPVYIGAIVIFLALLGLIIVDHVLKWPLVIATLLAVMLSWGKHWMPLSSLFMDYFPGYNKFRAVSMILVIAQLCLPILAFLAVDKLIRLAAMPASQIVLPLTGKSYPLKKILIAVAIVLVGFCLCLYLFPGTVNTFIKPGEETEIASKFRQSGASAGQIDALLPQYINSLETARETIFKQDVLRSLAFIAGVFLLLWLYLAKKIKKPLLTALLCVLLLFDLWPVAARYLNNRSFVPRSQYQADPPKTPADEQILSDPALDYRVLNLGANPSMDGLTSFYHKSIGGYHGAKLKKYDEMLSFHIFKESTLLGNGLYETQGNDSLLRALFLKVGVLNMLNTRYLIIPTREEAVALKNPEANGNAWLVKELKTVNSADSEIVGLYNINTKTQALVQQKNRLPGLSDRYSAEGSIALQSYAPNHLVYISESNDKQFAVFSEIHYPGGWNAYLDGKAAEHVNVNYILRGMEIPAGSHKIEFKFEPGVYKTGNRIALLGSVLLILSLAAGFYMARRTKSSL